MTCYDQGVERAGGGAVKATRDEQKPNNDDKRSVSNFRFYSHSDICPAFHHESNISSKVGPVNDVFVPVTCNGKTFTCIYSAAGAGETSTQVETTKEKDERQIK